MRLSYLANAISLIMMYIGMVILSPIIIALIYHDFYSVIPFLCASIISSAGGFIIRKLVPQSKELENLNDIKKSRSTFYRGSFVDNFRYYVRNSLFILWVVAS